MCQASAIFIICIITVIGSLTVHDNPLDTIIFSFTDEGINESKIQ